MKNKILSFTAIAIMMLFSACSTDQLFDESKVTPESGRTISLTASMPEDEPTSRVGLEQKEDKSIALTWEVDDKLQLVFVQGATKTKSMAEVVSISADKKNAEFNIVLPTTGFDENQNFNLYGVYGGGALSETNPTQVTLPINPGEATSLQDVKINKDVMLYFTAEDVNLTTNSNLSVMFQHLGSLFSISLKNDADTSLDGLTEARLVGVDGDGDWAYNSGTGGEIYDLESKTFLNEESASNFISFKAGATSLAAGETMTFWGWYPPLPGKNWPELKLELRDVSGSIALSENSKAARTTATAVGKSYYFLSTWDGSELVFEDLFFVHVGTMGDLGTLLTSDQKSSITRLKVTGELNKADFDVMTNMPNLSYIDLEDATCENSEIPAEAYNKNKIIETVILPSSVTSIGSMAFYQCSNLTGHLTIPDGVTIIKESAFQECKFTGLTLPEGLETIEASGFRYNPDMKGHLIIPNSVTTIGYMGLYNCKFTSVTLPNNLTTISERTFDTWNALEGTLTIPNSVTTIERRAFNDVRTITSLVLGDKVTTIGEEAFRGVKEITGIVTFPPTLTSMESGAFLASTKVNLFKFTNDTPIDYITDMLPAGAAVEVPEGTKGAYIAAGWDDTRNPISDVTPEQSIHVNTMGSLGTILSANQKTGITSLKLTGKINKADFDVMKNDMPILTHLDLKDVTCEDGKIPDEAFGGATEAEANNTIISLILPDNITAIGNDAFNECRSITGDLIIPENVTTIGLRAFRRCYGFTGNLILPDGLTKISNMAFFDCQNLTGDLIIPNSVTEIGYHTFNNCFRMTGSLTISSGITRIEEATFRNCNGLTGDLIIPENVNYIGLGAFLTCRNLTGSLIIPNKVKTIGKESFKGCKGFTELIFEDNSSITTIRELAFSDCTNISGDVIFPSTLTSIWGGGFEKCTGVNAFKFPHMSFPYTTGYDYKENFYETNMLPSGANVKVPVAAVDDYKVADGWKDFHLTTIEGY